MDELILRYLDRQTTPQEEADLAAQLRGSRDARRRFARASRLHGNLAGVLTETAREWTAPAPPTLADRCGDLLAAIVRIRVSRVAGDSDLLRGAVRAVEDPDARYALVAFLDETMAALSEAWSPLQLDLFNELSAGDGFYDRLETLRAAKNVDVLEVYYLCLALGFQGKHRDLAGLEKKKVLMDDLLRELHPSWSGLSPNWRPPDRAATFGRRTPAWAAAAACVLVVVMLYVFLSSLLTASAQSLLDNLK